MTPSLIVTTYNRPDALDRVLESLSRQSSPPDEVLIADDGSGPATAACVARWQAVAPFPVHHVWQPDEGFRAAAARNRAAARARGDYLIFLDGDCVAFPDFVRRHRQLAETHCFVAGNRLLLDAATTNRIVSERGQPAQWSLPHWLAERARGHVNRLLPLVRLGDGRWRKAKPREWRKVRTCNLGLWRADFVAINGFDEAFRGWGHEDADLAVRLIRAGVMRKSGQCALPVVHLWHPENRRHLEGENFARLTATLDGKRGAVCAQGVDQYG